jgi:coenzyme F420 hydrogenase subunit beta
MVHRIEEVVERGMCVGCGACGVATSGAIPVTLGRYGVYEAKLEEVSEADRRSGSAVCPFSDEAADESELGVPSPPPDVAYDPQIGAHTLVRGGRLTDQEELLASSSGGLTSWTLKRLIETGQIDAVIHVTSTPEGPELFEYTVSDSAQQIDSRKKSHYYATTLDRVLTGVRGDGRKYAIVGVPCYIKAARLLCRQDALLKNQLAYFIGIVCGHLKSQFFAESMAWQDGTPPDSLEAVDFRLKNPDRRAVDYDFGSKARGASSFNRQRNSEHVGAGWGHGAMQPEACNFCDDIFAETADVVFGDAWLPQYESNWRGTNILVSRNALIDRLLTDGEYTGEIELEQLTPRDAVQSQAGNFRHRRDGLAVRLADDISKGLSVPIKRVEPSLGHVTRRRRRLIRQRRAMSRISLESFADAREADNLALYLVPMDQAISEYRRIERPRFRRLTNPAKRGIRALVARLLT